MIAALGAVTGFDDWAPDLITDTPPGELEAELNATVREILGLPPRGRPRHGGARSGREAGGG